MKRNLTIPGGGSLDGLRNYLVVNKGVSLSEFLTRFDFIHDCIAGDLLALERMAFEAVEDAAKQGILYFETRFCPHLVIPKVCDDPRKWVWEVSAAVIKGLKHGEIQFRAKGNIILACIRGRPCNWFQETLELWSDKNFHGGRIVGVDIAGLADTAAEEYNYSNITLDFCNEALKLGVNRTLHAGESGNADAVTAALDKFHAQRIGHGYRIVNDPKVYDRIRQDKIHLETCPWSSILTASVLPSHQPHPIVQFFRDDLNISINTDDPTCTGSQLDDEYNLVRSWGLTEAHIVKSNFNAAKATFLPELEKAELIQTLAKYYGIGFG